MFTHFAEATGESGGLLGALGIDPKLLIEQLIAFLILTWILSKFVFPPLIRAVDKRQEAAEKTMKEAAEARKKLEEAESKADALLAKARKQADEVITRGNEASARVISEAEIKAKQRSEQIVADAQTQIQAEVRKAKTALRKDAVSLVASATEKIIGVKVDTAKDNALIEKSLQVEANS